MKFLGLKPKIPKPGPAARAVTRDDAREAAERDDELRRRRGGAADILTGNSGAEAGSTGKVQLG